MRTCRDSCRYFPPIPRNYKNGRKSCRQCSIFVNTLENYCPCCSNPLASKGRANITQLIRRAGKKTTRNISADKEIVKEAAKSTISAYDLLSEAERIMAKFVAMKKIGENA